MGSHKWHFFYPLVRNRFPDSNSISSKMNDIDLKYECVNCGKRMQELFKEYSPTVLKLMECDSCHNIADKYIEYDPVVVMIDLVLLNKQAYRHILCNSDFKNYWKLAIVLLLVETYCEWVSLKTGYPVNSEHGHKSAELMFEGEKYFYIICLQIFLGHLVFIFTVMITTQLIMLISSRINPQESMWKILWKAYVLSNFGKFFMISDLIWGSNGSKLTNLFVTVYTFMSQLQSYSVVYQTSKLLTGSVVLMGLLIKSTLRQPQSFNLKYMEQIEELF